MAEGWAQPEHDPDLLRAELYWCRDELERTRRQMASVRADWLAERRLYDAEVERLSRALHTIAGMADRPGLRVSGAACIAAEALGEL